MKRNAFNLQLEADIVSKSIQSTLWNGYNCYCVLLEHTLTHTYEHSYKTIESRSKIKANWNKAHPIYSCWLARPTARSDDKQRRKKKKASKNVRQTACRNVSKMVWMKWNWDTNVKNVQCICLLVKNIIHTSVVIHIHVWLTRIYYNHTPSCDTECQKRPTNRPTEQTETRKV